MESKRGMAIKVVVGLIIALVVALLLLALITGRFGTVRDFASCPGQNGVCAAECPPSGNPDKSATVFTNDCKDEKPKCCIPIG